MSKMSLNTDSRRKSKRWLLWGGASAGTLALIVVALIVGQTYFARTRTPEPPEPNLAGIDPAVRQTIEKEIAQVQREPQSADAWGRLGYAFLANVFEDEANFCFAEAERLDPHNARWIYCQGLILLSRDRAAALPKIELAVAYAGFQVEGPRLQLADLCFASGETEKARHYYEMILALSPQHPRALLGLARIDLQSGDVVSSRKRLEVPLADRRTRKSALALSAEIYLRQQDEKAANRELAQMIDLSDEPEWPDEFLMEKKKFKTGEVARLQVIYELNDSGHPDEAIRAAQELVRDYPQSARSWAALGVIHLSQHKYALAEQALRKSIALDANAPNVWVNLGLCRYHQKDLAEAVSCFQSAIQHKGDLLEAHFNMALCRLEQGKRADAIASLRDALRCQPLSAAAHAKLGEVLLEEKQYRESLLHFQQAVDLDPKNAEYQKKLEDARQRPSR
ncbi:MAG TPA: tetratricopeptide repeat protein [Gemmataceae bacterium]|nr:tetratricopeptide repeat protein [Gemmataceae bacterium]